MPYGQPGGPHLHLRPLLAQQRRRQVSSQRTRLARFAAAGALWRVLREGEGAAPQATCSAGVQEWKLQPVARAGQGAAG